MSAAAADGSSAPIRRAAAGASGRRIAVSLGERRLYLLDGPDTLLAAPIAVGSGDVLRHQGQVWDFSTPRGRRKVLRKARDPVWVPPDWHYVELAQRWGWRLVRLGSGPTPALEDGSRLVMRERQVVRILSDGTTQVLPPGEEIVIDGVLFVPPVGTVNREVPGELGRYKLDLGDGYLLHGTPHTESVGAAVTHGCVRLLDEDLEHLFEQTPVGTPVYIY